MKRILILALLAVFAHPAFAETGQLRMYGNWCGPGTNIFNNYPPIDPLDGACMRHDRCYVANGIGACGCDISLMYELRNMSYPNPDIETRARAIYDALAITPCDDPNGWAVKQSLMWSDIASDAVSGRATPFEVPARWMYLLSRSNPYY